MKMKKRRGRTAAAFVYFVMIVYTVVYIVLVLLGIY